MLAIQICQFKRGSYCEFLGLRKEKAYYEEKIILCLYRYNLEELRILIIKPKKSDKTRALMALYLTNSFLRI